MRSSLALTYRPVDAARKTSRVDRWLGARLQAVLTPSAVRLELWDRSSPGLAAPPLGTLVVRDRRALVDLLVDPDLAFGERYTEGRIDIRGDMIRVLEALSRTSLNARKSLRERMSRVFAPWNTLSAARRNIHHHYDLGNDFYRLWLDREMVYTCAFYPTTDATLDAAQSAKMELVCRKIALRPGERVVEAGCGWGALALHMARHHGVKVRAFNISTEQLDFARARARREGLDHLVEFIEDDYRNVSGRFDAFVSVGMLEHVGTRQFATFADVIARTIHPHGGRGLLHFIGRDRSRPLNAWIRRRIFPGAYAPTLSEVSRQVLEPARMSLLDIDNLRLHYARTLTDWRTRFEHAESQVLERFGPSFYRAWHLYLAGSEAAFTTGWLQLFQIVFAPCGGRIVHWNRGDTYRGWADA